jgi:hypothetical protein
VVSGRASDRAALGCGRGAGHRVRLRVAGRQCSDAEPGAAADRGRHIGFWEFIAH